MTPGPPVVKRVCLSEAVLPGRTMIMAARLAGKQLGPDSGTWCVREQHGHGTAHAGCIVDVSHHHAVWVAWRDGEVPTRAVVLSFCPARQDRRGCSIYRNHPGGHTWELRNSLDR